MPRLPVISGGQLIAALQGAGLRRSDSEAVMSGFGTKMAESLPFQSTRATKLAADSYASSCGTQTCRLTNSSLC